MRAAALLLLSGAAACTSSAPPPAANAPRRPAVEPTVLHLSGEAPLAPAGSGAPGTVVAAVYRVCLDERGQVTSVVPDPGLAAADDAVAAALRKWSWFVLAADTRSTCWHERVLLPVPSAGKIERQATSAVRSVGSHGPQPDPPAWLSTVHGKKIVDAVYKVCVGDDGAVQTVRPIVSIAGADDSVTAAMRASSWDLIVGSLAQAPYCFAAPIRLDLTHNERAPATGAPASPFPAEAARATAPGTSVVVHAKYVSGDYPHLPDTVRVALVERGGGKIATVYRTCVAPDGHVADVSPIQPIPGDDGRAVAALRTWRFAVSGTPGVGVCFDNDLVFNVTTERRFN